MVYLVRMLRYALFFFHLFCPVFTLLDNGGRDTEHVNDCRASVLSGKTSLSNNNLIGALVPHIAIRIRVRRERCSTGEHREHRSYSILQTFFSPLLP